MLSRLSGAERRSAFTAPFSIRAFCWDLLAGTGYASAFIGAVVFRLVAIVIIVVLVKAPPRMRESERGHTAPVSIRQLFTLPLSAAYIIAFVDYLFVGFDISLTPIWLHDNLGASVVMIGIIYMAFSITSIICAPLGGRVADRRRRSTMILIFGLAQVPLYIIYGLASTAIIIAIGFAIHGIVYSFTVPAIDSHLATAASSDARARVQGLYSAFGMVGGFVGSAMSSALYAVSFRLPLPTIGIIFGIGILLGGTLVRRSEAQRLVKPAVN
jgi:predicted MFS family arabinose efflux permease